MDRLVKELGQWIDDSTLEAITQTIGDLKDKLGKVPSIDARLVLEQMTQLGATVARDFGMGKTSIAASLLTNPFNNDWINTQFVVDKYDKEMLTLLEGLKKISGLNTSKTRIHSEKFIELLLSISQDVRVVLIKTAERLLAVRGINSLPKGEQLDLAHEASDLYAPIAHRLGLYLIKNELEETALKYLHPEVYNDIARRLLETRKSREDYIEKFVQPIREKLQKAGYDCEVKGRPKSIHSIWKKMTSQGVDFDEVYDLFAIRIILNKSSANEKSDCWQVYSIITDQYQPNPNRLRDWISSPKANGYESLHTTVIGPEGRWVEVQIRTRRMDVIAEKGHASHWRYKENKLKETTDTWLNQIRIALETNVEKTTAQESKAKTELYLNQIYVFTPTGDLLKLKYGSTILDFAFGVHTDVGYHCTGAKVNGQIVPIRHQLTNGDQVEVLTSPLQKPKSDWLNIVVTSKAKSRIKRVLKEADYQDAVEGKEILKRKFDQWKVRYDVTTVHKLMNWLNIKTALGLYQQIADNKIDMAAVKEWLRQKDPAEYLKERPAPSKSVEEFTKSVVRQENYLLIEDSVEHVDYKMARCCNPIFGDEVFGFVTVTDGAKIHRVNCPNAREMIKRYPYRIVKVRWTDSHGDDTSYTVNVDVSGIDDIGIVNEISKVISTDLRVQMIGMKMGSDDGLFEGILTLVVNDKTHLETIMNRIRKVKGVLRVSRTDDF